MVGVDIDKLLPFTIRRLYLNIRGGYKFEEKIIDFVGIRLVSVLCMQQGGTRR